MRFPKLDKQYWLPIMKISALWSLPIGAYVIVDAYRRAEGLPVLWKGVQHPGFLLHIILSPGGPWAAIHDYSWTVICVYSCLCYYVVVMLLVMLWRKVRKPAVARDLEQ